MKDTLTLLTVLLLAQVAALHAAETPVPSPVKTGVILVNHVGFPLNAAKYCVIPSSAKGVTQFTTRDGARQRRIGSHGAGDSGAVPRGGLSREVMLCTIRGFLDIFDRIPGFANLELRRAGKIDGIAC